MRFTLVRRTLGSRLCVQPCSLCCSRGLAALVATSGDTNLATLPRPSKSLIIDESQFDRYWANVLRAEEEALQNTRPWEQLRFLPIDGKKPIVAKKGEFLYKDYLFGKSIEPSVVEQLEFSQPAIQLHYPFEPSTQLPPPSPTMPTLMSEEQWRQAFGQARIYILGVLHNQKESREDAKKLIETVQPDILMLEMNEEGLEHNLRLEWQDDWKAYKGSRKERLIQQARAEKAFKAMPWYQKVNYKLLDWMRKPCFGESEMHTAYQTAKGVPGCAGIVLGDHPEACSTIHRHMSYKYLFNLRKRMKMWDLIGQYEKNFPLFWDGNFNVEAVAKAQEELNAKFKEFGFPEFVQFMVETRDRCMIRALHTMVHRCTIEKLCSSQRARVPFEPLTVVGMVGGSHLFGISCEWAKTEVLYPKPKPEGSS